MNLEKLEIKEWLQLNAKLQQKKNALRKKLKEKGVMKKDGKNNFDNYKYFSEAGYKMLFTELLSANNLEVKANEIAYDFFEGKNEKMPNGRKVTFEFTLTDCDTGFYEVSAISGEGLDKGDKAGYKADTGALKYYLANTFMVATGDDAEAETPVSKTMQKATPKQVQMLSNHYIGDNLKKLLDANKIEKLEDMPKEKATELIGKLMEKGKQQNV